MNLPPCNFRPIIPSDRFHCSSMIYRSNSIDDGKLDSVQWLFNEVKIKLILDLRNEIEFHPNSQLDQCYQLIDFDEINEFQQNLDKYDSIKGYRCHVGFSYGNFNSQFGTVEDFYLHLIDNNKHVMKSIFSFMGNSKNFPILITCSYGKDRTGVVSAMVLDLVGCDQSTIIDEYLKSDALLKPVQERLNQIVKEKNINPEFAKCPIGAIQQFVIYLKTKYGGTKGYLKECGLTELDIEKIRSNLLNVTETNRD